MLLEPDGTNPPIFYGVKDRMCFDVVLAIVIHRATPCSHIEQQAGGNYKSGSVRLVGNLQAVHHFFLLRRTGLASLLVCSFIVISKIIR